MISKSGGFKTLLGKELKEKNNDDEGEGKLHRKSSVCDRSGGVFNKR
jgi:hypothetical protein